MFYNTSAIWCLLSVLGSWCD